MLRVLAPLVVLAVGLYVAERFVRRSPLRFPYLTGELASARYDELAAEPGWQRAGVDVAPGIKLNGLVRRAAAGAPWVLFFSGNDAHLLTRGQSVLTSLAAGRRDWGLAVFAYRGFESSGGEPTLDALAADGSAVVDYLATAHGVRRSALHVVGFSIGGHLAVRAVAAQHARGERVRSLSLLASVNDIVMFRRSPWQKLSLGDAYRTAPYLADLPAPVLVLQGTADEALLGPEQGRAIARALGGRAVYVELAGVGHEALLEDAVALQKVHELIAAP